MSNRMHFLDPVGSSLELFVEKDSEAESPGAQYRLSRGHEFCDLLSTV